MSKDYYKTLEISSSATEAEVKKSYKRLALKYHPDKNRSPDAGEQFKMVSEAYEVLSDKVRRQVYDLHGEQGLNDNGEGHYGSRYQDIRTTFKQFFQFNDPLLSYRFTGDVTLESFVTSELKPPRARQIEVDVNVSLEEIACGCTKEMTVIRKVIDSTDTRISYKHFKIFTVHIKPGAKEGTTITFASEGNETHGKKKGDVVFTIRSKPHPIFKRQNSDILYTAKVIFNGALSGVKVEVPTLQGNKIKLTLRKHEVKSNTVKRIPLQGLTSPFGSGARGDLVVSFDFQSSAAGTTGSINNNEK